MISLFNFVYFSNVRPIDQSTTGNHFALVERLVFFSWWAGSFCFISNVSFFLIVNIMVTYIYIYISVVTCSLTFLFTMYSYR